MPTDIISPEFAALLAQSAGGADAPAGPSLGSFLLPMMVVIILYIFIIDRPARRERMQRENQINALKKGVWVATIGGIVGRIDSVDKATGHITLLVDKGSKTRLTFMRSAIDRVIESPGQTQAKKGKASGEDSEDANNDGGGDSEEKSAA